MQNTLEKVALQAMPDQLRANTELIEKFGYSALDEQEKRKNKTKVTFLTSR